MHYMPELVVGYVVGSVYIECVYLHGNVLVTVLNARNADLVYRAIMPFVEIPSVNPFIRVFATPLAIPTGIGATFPCPVFSHMGFAKVRLFDTKAVYFGNQGIHGAVITGIALVCFIGLKAPGLSG